MRVFFIAWQDPESRSWRPVGRLTFDNETYKFVYTKGALTRNFIPFGFMHDLHSSYESPTLFPLFTNRLLTKNRPEYNEFLNWLNLTPDGDNSASQLALTGGIRGTDSLMVFPLPEPQSNHTYYVQFLCHGIRYLAEEAQKLIAQLKPGTRLYPMFDVQNMADPSAISMRTEPAMIIGYIPRYFVHDIRILLSTGQEDSARIFVEKVNPDAPVQFKLLCSFTSNWPKGFRPFSGSLFQPIDQERRRDKKLSEMGKIKNPRKR